MSEWVSFIQGFGEFGWGAVVFILVMMLFRGSLATGRELQDRDKQLAFLQEANRDLAAGLRENAEAIRTCNSLLQSIIERSQRGNP